MCCNLHALRRPLVQFHVFKSTASWWSRFRMIHEYSKQDVPFLLACSKPVLSHLLRYFFSGASLKPNSTSLLCCFGIKGLQAVTEKGAKRACAESAQRISFNGSKKIRLSASFVHTACLTLFAHCCHFAHLAMLHHIHLTSFTQTDHIIRDYSAIRSRMCCTSEFSQETCHQNINPAGSLLFADIFFCWPGSTSSQCNTCPELFCFALKETKMEFFCSSKTINMTI